MATVQCTNGGLAALRHEDTWQLVEIVPDIRSSGKIPSETRPKIGQHYLFDFSPRCLLGAHPLPQEFEDTSGTKVDKFLHVMTKERDCNRFTPWRPGLMPKEHSEMLRQEEFEERNRRHEMRMAAIACLAVVVSVTAVLVNVYAIWNPAPIPVNIAVEHTMSAPAE